jgi:hypothetical protein
MLKITKTYIDFNGNERTEDFYFNLSKAEVMKMEMSTSGGLAEHIQRVVKAQDSAEIIAIFEKLVLDAYGVKSADGKRFEKNAQIRDEFAQTQAYSDIFVELATNADKAVEFVNGIIPQADEAPKADHPALKK